MRRKVGAGESITGVWCDDHQVCSSYFITTEITGQTVENVFNRPLGLTGYAFIEIALDRGNQFLVYFGQAPRHEEFKRIIRDQKSNVQFVVRGQVSNIGVYNNIEIGNIELLDDELKKFLSKVGNAKLAVLIRQIIASIDPVFIRSDIYIKISDTLRFVYDAESRMLQDFSKLSRHPNK